jgi:hypothetical protein
MENRGRPPAVQAGQRAGQRPGHHLDLQAPLDRDLPARLYLPRCGPAFQRTRDEDAGILGLIPVTIPELLRQLRGTVIPGPRRDRAHRDGWSLCRHQYRARQAHQRWQAYADALPE